MLAPIIWSAVWKRRHEAALILFGVAAASDAIDGYLARKLGSATPSGAYLDPIADKLLLSGIYLMLAAIGSLPWWLVGLILGRDLVILIGALVVLLITRARTFPPSVWGKASTLFQILTATAFLARNATHSQWLERVSALLIWPTAVLTLWSGLHYCWRGIRLVLPD